MNEKQTQNEPLTEEEFLQLVLEEQQKALAKEQQERVRRAQGLHTPRKRHSFLLRIIAYLAACTLVINALALFFEIYSIPAVDFMKTSASLLKEPIIQQAKEAVVEIRTDNSKGTGFSVSEDGWILTNAHVVDDAMSLTVSFPSHGIYEATVIALIPAIDTAYLKINTRDAPYVSLATSPVYPVNEPITFIGNPLSFSGIANKGTIQAPVYLQNWPSAVYQMDAPVYKGNSGSPVFNAQMDVIGIIFATTDNAQLGKVGLFVPISDVLRGAPTNFTY